MQNCQRPSSFSSTNSSSQNFQIQEDDKGQTLKQSQLWTSAIKLCDRYMCIYTSLQESCSGEGGESNFFHKCAYSATRNMRSFLHSANMRRAPILSSALLVNWMKLWTRETCSLRRKYRFIKYSLATCSSWAAFLSGWRVQVILQLCLRDHSCAVCLVIPGPSGEGFLLSPDVS